MDKLWLKDLSQEYCSNWSKENDTIISIQYPFLIKKKNWCGNNRKNHFELERA